MIQVSVKADMRRVVLQLGRLQEEVTGKAAARALNRTAVTIRAEASREIRKVYNLKAAELRDELRLTRATARSLRAVVSAKGRRLTLMRFNAKQNARGVAVTIKRGQRETIKSAFIRPGTGGNPVVFARGVYTRSKFPEFVPGKPRKPITALKTLSIPVMFSQQAITQALERIAHATFARNFRHELTFAASRVR